jgi:hypothetical protein
MAIVKMAGRHGQVTLSKEYAGRPVLMDEIEPGVWIIKLGEFIPESERWLRTPQVKANLDEAIAWAETHPPVETNLNE